MVGLVPIMLITVDLTLVPTACPEFTRLEKPLNWSAVVNSLTGNLIGLKLRWSKYSNLQIPIPICQGRKRQAMLRKNDI